MIVHVWIFVQGLLFLVKVRWQAPKDEPHKSMKYSNP